MVSAPLRILIVEDSPDDAALLIWHLKKGGYEPACLVVGNAMQMQEALKRHWDVILSDHSLPAFDSFQALEVLKQTELDIPFIIVSGAIDQDIAIAAMQAGAHDYLLKDNLVRLVPAVRREMQEARNRQLRRVAERELAAVKEELAVELSNMTCLHQLSVRLSAARDLQHVLREIISGVLSLQDTGMGVLLLYDETKHRLSPAMTHGVPEKYLHTECRAGPGSASYMASAERRPVNLSLDACDVAALFKDAAREAGYNTVFAVPLFTRDGDLLGCIETYRQAQGEPAAREARLIELYVRQAGEVLDNVRLYAKSQESNRLKDEFVAMVSHELRTPLTPILGAVHIIRGLNIQNPALERPLDMIERNVRSQAQIVDDLLDMSRIVSGKLRLRLAGLDLQAVIEAAVSTIKPIADAKGVRLEVSIPAGVGSIQGDAERLQQVIWNLLSNAVKFTPPEGLIRIELESRRNVIELRVSDTGAGIRPEFLPYVFERFRQADSSTSRSQGGLGLGLSIVRQLVELHGGRVRAESSGAGKGSCFTVTFPLRMQRPARSA